MADAAPAVGSRPGGSSVIASVTASLRLCAIAPSEVDKGTAAMAPVARTVRRFSMFGLSRQKTRQKPEKAPVQFVTGERKKLCTPSRAHLVTRFLPPQRPLRGAPAHGPVAPAVQRPPATAYRDAARCETTRRVNHARRYGL